jgi:hypothetical protein
MLQPITPPPTITTWARLGKSVGMSRLSGGDDPCHP